MTIIVPITWSSVGPTSRAVQRSDVRLHVSAAVGKPLHSPVEPFGRTPVEYISDEVSVRARVIADRYVGGAPPFASELWAYVLLSRYKAFRVAAYRAERQAVNVTPNV